MSDQKQCPNCGGYKLTSQSTPIKQTVALTQDELKSEKRGGIAMLITFLIPSIIVTVGSAVLSLFSTSEDSFNFFEKVGRVSGFVALFFTVVVVYALSHRTKTVQIGKQISFDCVLCGYHWGWREGDPWPRVHVNPELILKGEQRLEEKKRRSEEEAALYQISKLGKK